MPDFETIPSASSQQEEKEKVESKIESPEDLEEPIEMIDYRDKETEALNNLKPSGDWNKDLEDFLTITGRETYLPALRRGEIHPMALITDLKKALPEVLSLVKSPKTQENLSASISVLDRIIEMGAVGRVLSSEERAELDDNVSRLPTPEKISGSGSVVKAKERIDTEGPVRAGESGLEEGENATEKREKNEWMESIAEKVKNKYEDFKARKLAQEQRLDSLFDECISKLVTLREKYPHLIDDKHIRNAHDEKRELQAINAESYIFHEANNTNVLSILEGMSADRLSFEDIEAIEESNDQMFEVFFQTLDMSDQLCERFQKAVENLPTAEEAEREPEALDDIEEKLEDLDKSKIDPPEASKE